MVSENVECSCAHGYFLDSDYKSCISNGENELQSYNNQHKKKRKERNFFSILSETFKCGSLITGNQRKFFRYERENVTDENTTKLNQTDNVEQMRNNSSTEIPLEDQVVEEPHSAEMVGLVRIVNGEDCPLGECPWQVIYTLHLRLLTGVLKQQQIFAKTISKDSHIFS